MGKSKYSDDPKVIKVSLERFFEETKLLEEGIIASHYIKDSITPKGYQYFYKFTPSYFILVNFTMSCGFLLVMTKPLLEKIKIAERDGVKEYKLISNKLEEYEKQLAKNKKSYELDLKVRKLRKLLKAIPPYAEPAPTPEPKPFEKYLVNTKRKFNTSKYEKKFVVLDVETNGLRPLNDDLLSLSIYDPSTGICYNRYLPLQMQPVVLTTFIHGITDEKLSKEAHISQKEVNEIIKYFDLKNKTILSFSGGEGKFDQNFLFNYCKRRGLKGFEEFNYQNIKSFVPQVPYGCEGSLSKDNLCRIFKIEGIKKMHSSLNDCILEWQLFEKLYEQKVFFIKEHIYKYHPGYIVPISYLTMHPELVNYAGINLKPILGHPKLVFEYKFPDEALKGIQKFETNITGIMLEHAIDSLLKVKEQDNSKFLIENKKHLEYIGSLDSRIKSIPIITESDGTVRTLDPQYENFVKETNDVNKKIMTYLDPLINCIKKDIFPSGKILSQELVISKDKKILAKCDLSNKDSVLEIKTFSVLDNQGYVRDPVAEQLYYQANGRKTFVLSFYFKTHRDSKYSSVTDALSIYIYEVKFENKEKPVVYRTLEYSKRTCKLFEMIRADNHMSLTKYAEAINFSVRTAKKITDYFINKGYLEKIGTGKKLTWIIKKDVHPGDTVKISTREITQNWYI